MRSKDPLETHEEAPSRMRKGIYVLPNLFTLAALFGGRQRDRVVWLEGEGVGYTPHRSIQR